MRTLIRTRNHIWHSNTYNWWCLPPKRLGLLGIAASAVLIGILLPGLARLVREWLVLFDGLIMIYKLASSRPTKFSDVWLGALGATVLIWLGELLFLVYAANFAHCNVLYGALGGIVAFLLWVYRSRRVSVFGVRFCSAQTELQGRANDPTRTSP